MVYTCLEMKSPLGPLRLIADDNALVAILFDKEKDLRFKAVPGTNAILKLAKKELTEYFTGHRQDFDIPLRLTGTTFQIQAWKVLMQIPFGKTISYQEQATKMKNPKGVRAVGRANGRNTLPIVIPCHRVIGKNGKLTGYAGGLDRKSILLSFES